MADRCDHCQVRMDGIEVHADDCPVKGPEIREESSAVKEESAAVKLLLERYMDRCPCSLPSLCDLCEEADKFI